MNSSGEQGSDEIIVESFSLSNDQRGWFFASIE
jgi:hypothetical protein